MLEDPADHPSPVKKEVKASPAGKRGGTSSGKARPAPKPIPGPATPPLKKGWRPVPEDKRRRRTLLAAAEGARALGTGRGGLLGEAAAAGGSIGHGNAMAAGDRHALVASGDEMELKDDTDASMVDVFVHRENHHEHGRGFSRNDQQFLPEDEEDSLRGLKYRTCAIVGNSGILKRTLYGPDIDAHDAVFRINQAPGRQGGCSPYAGSRTTFRVINAHWLKKYSHKSLGPVLPMEENSTLLITRFDKKDFVTLNNRMAEKGRSDVRVRIFSRYLQAAAQKMVTGYRKALEVHRKFDEGDRGSAPTTGMIAVYASLFLCKSVSLYGFGLTNANAKHAHERQKWYHYFNGLYGKKEPDDSHSFDTEAFLLRAMSDVGVLSLCSFKEDRSDGWRPEIIAKRVVKANTAGAALDEVATVDVSTNILCSKSIAKAKQQWADKAKQAEKRKQERSFRAREKEFNSFEKAIQSVDDG